MRVVKHNHIIGLSVSLGLPLMEFGPRPGVLERLGDTLGEGALQAVVDKLDGLVRPTFVDLMILRFVPFF